MSRPDHHRTLARLAARGAHLRIDTAEICCLAAMHLQAEAGGSMLFGEEALADLFEATLAAVIPSDNPRKRATHAIERLRAQGLVVRIDAAGMVKAGEYALSTLAQAVVGRFLHNEALTRASLDGLLGSVIRGLSEVLVAAQEAAGGGDPEAWRDRVRGPLEVVVSELLSGVERRQLGLDESQRAIRAEITRLLEADWLDALGGIEGLLDETADTLTELKGLLLQHATRAHGLLDEVRVLAQEHGRIETLVAVRRTGEQLDRLLAWGRSRHAAWSEYHRAVHRFLRDVVRLDPDRQLSNRLRQAIGEWPKHRYTLRVAQAPRLTVLPPPSRVVAQPAVRRVRQEYTPVDAAPPAAPPVDLAGLVDLALADGADRLSAVLARVLPQVPPEARYGMVGRVAALVAHRSRRTVGARWIAVPEVALEVTDWTLWEEDA